MKGDRVCVSIEPITESGWYHGVREAFVPVSWGEGFLFFQDAENGAQLRSQLASILNVLQMVRLRRLCRLRPCCPLF